MQTFCRFRLFDWTQTCSSLGHVVNNCQCQARASLVLSDNVIAAQFAPSTSTQSHKSQFWPANLDLESKGETQLMLIKAGKERNFKLIRPRFFLLGEKLSSSNIADTLNCSPCGARKPNITNKGCSKCCKTFAHFQLGN